GLSADAGRLRPASSGRAEPGHRRALSQAHARARRALDRAVGGTRGTETMSLLTRAAAALAGGGLALALAAGAVAAPDLQNLKLAPGVVRAASYTPPKTTAY